jgi:hypothetical protein
MESLHQTVGESGCKQYKYKYATGVEDEGGAAKRYMHNGLNVSSSGDFSCCTSRAHGIIL